MTKPILVAYATKRETTHEVADALASRMRRLGHEVDVRPAAEVGTLRPYGGVVLGGALSLSDRRLRVGAPKPARKSALQPAE